MFEPKWQCVHFHPIPLTKPQSYDPPKYKGLWRHHLTEYIPSKKGRTCIWGSHLPLPHHSTEFTLETCVCLFLRLITINKSIYVSFFHPVYIQTRAGKHWWPVSHIWEADTFFSEHTGYKNICVKQTTQKNVVFATTLKFLEEICEDFIGNLDFLSQVIERSGPMQPTFLSGSITRSRWWQLLTAGLDYTSDATIPTAPQSQHIHMGHLCTSGHVSVCVNFYDFVFFCCLNIPTKKVWAPAHVTRCTRVIRLIPATCSPSCSFLWSSETQMYQWNSIMPFCLWFPSWPLIKALAYRSSLSLTSSPTWLSPIPGGSSHAPSFFRTCVYNTYLVSYVFWLLEYSLNTPQGGTCPLTDNTEGCPNPYDCAQGGIDPDNRQLWVEDWQPHPARSLDVGAVPWSPFHEEW